MHFLRKGVTIRQIIKAFILKTRNKAQRTQTEKMKKRYLCPTIITFLLFVITYNIPLSSGKATASLEYDDDSEYSSRDYEPIKNNPDDDYDDYDYEDEYNKPNINIESITVGDNDRENTTIKKLEKTIEFEISLPWVQDILKKDCNDDIRCMERKAELIGRQEIKSEFNFVKCPENDKTCKDFQAQLEKDYKERVYCPVTHPISYSDGKNCCPIQHWFERNHKYVFEKLNCLQEDTSNGCCNDVKASNCSSKFCYDNPIRYLDTYLMKSSKDQNPLCDMLSERCQDASMRAICPKTCEAKDKLSSNLTDDNILCKFLGKQACSGLNIRNLCPLTCGETGDNVSKPQFVECVDKKDWCNNFPNCETDVAKQICPKACKLCTVNGKL